MNWVHQEFLGLTLGTKNAPDNIERPRNFDEMRIMSRKLSEGIPFSRVDLYEINDKTYFGEITFYPRSGFGSFCPDQYNDILGKMISLPGLGGEVNS